MTELPVKGGYVAFIDDEDYDRVCGLSWCLQTGGYVKSHLPASDGGAFVLLHRYVLGYSGPLQVDHKNENKLDCRKSNLALLDHPTHAEKHKRTYGPRPLLRYKGVQRNRGKYAAVLERKWIGVFAAPELAAIAYNTAAVARFGEGCYTNPV